MKRGIVGNGGDAHEAWPRRDVAGHERDGILSTRILVVDENRLFSDVIREALSGQGFDVAVTAGTGDDGLAAARRFRPDVVLVDLGLRGGSGVEVARAIRGELPDAKVLGVAASSDTRKAQEAMRSGFHGCVNKNFSLGQLVAAVHATLRGHAVLPNGTASVGATPVPEGQRHALLAAEHLSPRERELLALLVDGTTSGQMAERLSLSPNTVRTHIQSIMSKLQVHSRMEAVTFAVKHGIVKVPRNAGRTTDNGWA